MECEKKNYIHTLFYLFTSLYFLLDKTNKKKLIILLDKICDAFIVHKVVAFKKNYFTSIETSFFSFYYIAFLLLEYDIL